MPLVIAEKIFAAPRAKISGSRIRRLGSASSVELSQQSTRLYTGNFRLFAIVGGVLWDNGNFGDKGEARFFIYGILSSVNSTPSLGTPV